MTAPEENLTSPRICQLRAWSCHPSPRLKTAHGELRGERRRRLLGRRQDACHTLTMTDLNDPMADLQGLYEQYASSVQLAQAAYAQPVSYWAPAPPPLTLASNR